MPGARENVSRKKDTVEERELFVFGCFFLALSRQNRYVRDRCESRGKAGIERLINRVFISRAIFHDTFAAGEERGGEDFLSECAQPAARFEVTPRKRLSLLW